MEQIELIYDFVDGTLSTESEQALFKLLNESEEARLELRQAMAMKGAIKSDVKAFTPSAKSTIAIFSGLGFTPPVAVIPPKIPLTTRLAEFAVRYKQAFIGGAFSACLTTAVLLILFNVKPGSELNNNNYAANSGKSAVSKPAVISSIESTESSNKSKIDKQAPKVIYKYVYVVPKNVDLSKIDKSNLAKNDLNSANEEKSNNINTAKENTSDVQNDNSKNLALIVPVNNQLESALTMNFNNSASLNRGAGTVTTVYIPNDANSVINNAVMNLSEKGALYGMNLEVYGSQYYMDNPLSVKPASEQSINNIAVAALYPVGGDFYAGVDYRRENFLQKFDGTENVISADGKIKQSLFTYQQNPNFQTVSAVVRYMPGYANFGFTNLFAQTSLGGNSVGVVLRAMLGARLTITDNYYLIVGYDYSSLFYSHQNSNYSSNKQGMQIGASIKF